MTVIDITTTCWSDNPDPDKDIFACPDCKSAPCSCPRQVACTGCTRRFPLEKLWAIDGEGHCLICFHSKTFGPNAAVDLAVFEEMIGGSS